MDKEKLERLFSRPDMTIKGAMQKLNETAEKILFVVDQHNKLLGTVSDGDIRRGLINGLTFSMSVEEVMHRDFTVVVRGRSDTEENIKGIMLERKLEQLPILNHEGIIEDVVIWTDVLGEAKSVKPVQLLPNPVVIMAGGKGTRLDPFTRILPKPLIPINNKPVIEHIMERFYQCGFYRFFYALNYKKEYVKLFLKENNFPYAIDWVEEDDFWGTAGGLSLLKDKIKDTFFVANCDSLLKVNFNDVLKWHKEHDASITIIGCHNEVKIPFGVLHLSNGNLDRIVEKPVHDVIINTGVYIMEPHILSYIPERKHLDMNELIERVIEKERITAYPIYDGWLDIGQWEEYRKSVEKLGGV